MREYKIAFKEVREVSRMVCNKCTNKIYEHQPSLSIDQVWGYWSKYDTQKHEFDLCELCYDKIISEFKIKPEITLGVL